MLGLKLLLARRGLPVVLILAVLAWSVTMLIWAPGFMSRDSGDQLAQARSLELSDEHPVMMALIWHVTDRVIEGPLGFFVLVCTIHWAGLALVFSALEGHLAARSLGMLFVGFFPPGFVNLPLICKDSLMQACLVAAVGCLMRSEARWKAARYVLAGVLLIIAVGARHNGATAVWPLLALPLLNLPVLFGTPRWLRLIAASAVSLVLTFALTVGVDRALSPLTKKAEFWQIVPVFDLAGMSLHSGQVLVEPESGVLSSGMGLEQIRRFYQASYVNRLYYCMSVGRKRCVPLFRYTQDPQRLAALSDNWLRAIVSHPVAYLQHRLAVVKALLRVEVESPPGAFLYDGTPHHALAKKYPPRPIAKKTFDWFDGQVASTWLRPWVYLLIGCVLFPVTLRHYVRGGAAVPLLFVLSALSYMLGLFVATGSAPFRYTVWTNFSVTLALATLCIPAFTKRRSGPSSQPKLAWRQRAIRTSPASAPVSP